MIKPEMWEEKGRRQHLNAGTWTWAEGAESEDKRTGFDLECSICEHQIRFSSREKALKFARTHDKCPECGRYILTNVDPW